MMGSTWGHPPFSHAGEAFGLMPMNAAGIPYSHEDYSAAIVSYLMRDVINDHPYNLTNYKITAQEISEFLRGDPSAGTSLIWRPLITGQIDADRADYLLRDSIHCGVEYGRYDLRRILVTLTLARDENDNPVLAVEEGGWHAAEGLILARYMMFTQVYFHQTRRAYDYHIGEVMNCVLSEAQKRTALENNSSFPPPTSEKGLMRYLRWSDWRVLGLIDARKAGPHGEIILNRSHDREVYSTPEIPTEKDLDRLERVVETLGDRVSYVDSASKSWYAFGQEDFPILPRDRDKSVPLSKFSSVVRGLKAVEQNRVYVRLSDQEEARRIVSNLRAE